MFFWDLYLYNVNISIDLELLSYGLIFCNSFLLKVSPG